MSMSAVRIERPDAAEHLPYYGKYIAQVPGSDARPALADQIEESMRLLTPLTEAQAAAAERLLDAASTVDKTTQMARVTALQSAARMIQVYLHSSYADNGQYPQTLTLDSSDLASLRASGELANALGSIEGYAATRDGFSLVVVGKDPRQRIRVTESRIEEIR